MDDVFPTIAEWWAQLWAWAGVAWRWLTSPELSAFSTVTGLTLVSVLGLILRWFLSRRTSRRTQLLPPAAAKRRKSERDYLGNFVTEMKQYWDPSRFVSLEGEIRSQTTLLWLPLLFVRDRSRVQGLDLPDRIQQSKVARTRNLISQILRLSRVVVLGEPGSGKTIMLRQIAIEIAGRSSRDSGTEFLIPIYVSLSEYTGTDSGRPGSLLDLLRTALARPNQDGSYGRSIAQRLEEYLDAGRLAIMFDSMDEMPKADYVDRFERVNDFICSHPGNVFVFACRINDFVDLPEFRVNQAIIRPLSKGQIRAVLRKYADATTAKRITRLIFEPGSPFAVHAVNPFFLTILAVSFAKMTESESYSWDDALRCYIATALHFHVIGEFDPATQVRDTTRFLSFLAYRAAEQQGSGTVISESLIADITLAGLDSTRCLEHARASGLLRPSGSGGLRFSHHRVQEYFAAVDLARRVDRDEMDVRVIVNDFWWREVIRMAAGVAEQPDALVRAVLGSQSRRASGSARSRRQQVERTLLGISCAHTAGFRLSSSTVARMTDALLGLLRNGSNVERVKALRVVSSYRDPIVWDEVRRLTRHESAWVRTTAVEAVATIARVDAALRSVTRSRFAGLVAGRLSPLEAWRDVIVLARRPRTLVDALWLAAGLCLGALRTVAVPLAILMAAQWLGTLGVLPDDQLSWVRSTLLWITAWYAFYHLVWIRLLQRDLDDWARKLLGSYNRFAGAVFCFVLTIRVGFDVLAYFARDETTSANALGERSWRSLIVSTVNLSILMVFWYFIFKSAPVWVSLFTDLVGYGRRKRIASYMVGRARGAEAALAILERAAEEPSPVLRAEMIRRLKDLTTIDERVLDSLEELERDEVDSQVRDVIGGVLLEMERRLQQESRHSPRAGP